jgi:3-oxoadipate enol-lactonase
MTTETGIVEVNGTRLYYEAAGSGPALVLIHGFNLDTRMWDDQFEVFAQHYRVVRYDARGFGQSALPTDEPYTGADDLQALLVLSSVKNLDTKTPVLKGVIVAAAPATAVRTRLV